MCHGPYDCGVDILLYDLKKLLLYRFDKVVVLAAMVVIHPPNLGQKKRRF
jgi:hypothetical protein